jgi:hypothetical protein
MSTISHESSGAVPEERRRHPELLGREMWAGVAISVMWLAVMFDALFGPNMFTHSAGGDGATIPSAVPLALFASLATWVVAKYGFGGRDRDAG